MESVDTSNDAGFDLTALGWSNHFMAQLDVDEVETNEPARVTEVHRKNVIALGPSGQRVADVNANLAEGGVTVGDWIVLDQHGRARLLERKSGLSRKSAGTVRTEQFIAANIDTLFITSSCNADFNVARIERYLVMANQAMVEPVILLTKADLAEDADDYVRRAQRSIPNVIVESLVATDTAMVLERLAPWCKAGKTVALLGSSGVGKTTLTNALTGLAQLTQDIREDDAKGRHTTTGRTMFAMPNGGWLIDTPGMRELQLHEVADGIDAVFDDIIQLAQMCKFHDCGHDSEPGCAVTKAINDGELDQDRLRRWQKLVREDLHNTETLAQSRARSKKWAKQISQGKARAKHKRGIYE